MTWEDLGAGAWETGSPVEARLAGKTINSRDSSGLADWRSATLSHVETICETEIETWHRLAFQSSQEGTWPTEGFRITSSRFKTGLKNWLLLEVGIYDTHSLHTDKKVLTTTTSTCLPRFNFCRKQTKINIYL